MGFQRTIDWLVKKVNELLDERCDCTNCSGSAIEPLIKVSTNNRGHLDSEQNIIPTQTVSWDNGIDTLTGIKSPLIVEIKNWQEIQDKNPILLLDRYKPQKSIKYDKGGYRHEPQDVAISNGRLSEVPLTDAITIVDFVPENYFNYLNNGLGSYIKTSGINIDRSTTKRYGMSGDVAHYFNFALRIRLTNNGVITETNQLIQMKCYLRVIGAKPNDIAKIKYAYI